MSEERGPSARAWGIGLGAWVALFAFLAVIVIPLLFAQCTGP